MWRSLCLAGGLIWGAASAQAELRVCNESGVARSVAIGYSDNGVWTSEGWWSVDAGACVLVRATDLTQRYIYWRATASGQEFEDEGFTFCVSEQPFTIVGDTDCDARGYTEAGFRSLDTGPEGTAFTLTIPVMDAPTPDAPTRTPPALARALPAPVPAQGDAFERGQRGEPFTQFALMQSCTGAGAERVCMLHADGWRYAAFAGDAPAPEILDALALLAPNTPVMISGDILFYGDITAEVILSRIAPGQMDPYAFEREMLQGAWVSDDDALYRLDIFGTEMVETYDGEETSVALFVTSDQCPDGSPTDGMSLGVYILGGDPESARCWALESMTDDTLSVFNLPRGNILSFRRP